MLIFRKEFSQIQQAAWSSIGVLTKKLKGKNYPLEIKEMVKERRKLSKNWQQQRDPTLKAALNKLTKQLSGTIKHLDNDKNSHYSLWKCTKTSNSANSTNLHVKSAMGQN